MKRCVLCVVLLVVVGLGGGVWANDDGWGDGSTSTKKPTVARPPANTPPPPREGPVDPTDPTIVPVEVTHLIAAKKILTKAQGDYDAFVAVKKAEFEGASEFVTAKSALEESERALVALKAPLQEKLRATDSAYAAAVKGLEGATQKLDEATATKKADEIAFRRYTVTQMQETIRKAEETFAKNAAVAVAAAKLAADQKVMASMQQKFQEYLNGHGDFVALSNSLTIARTRVATLSKDVPEHMR